MKKIITLVLVLCMTSALCACGQSTDNSVQPTAAPTSSADTVITTVAPTATAAVTATPAAEPTSSLEIVYVTPSPTNNITIVPGPGQQQQTVPSATAYSGIISAYASALNNKWDAQTCINNGVNYMVPAYAESAPESLGYYFMDVDNNGIEELIIGDSDQIIAMYTLSGSTPVQVIDAGERSAYYLEPDGVIVNSGSSSAYYHVYNLYELNGTSLKLKGSIISDYSSNYENPWYYSEDGDDNVYNDMKVSNETAESWITAYESNYVTLPYTRFV